MTSHRQRKALRLFIRLLLLGGVLLRLWFAWHQRFDPDPDRGPAILQTAHLAAGEYPAVFLYGQSHGGALEQLLGSVFGATLGVTAFTVNLGTAVMGSLLVPVLCAWAYAAGGLHAALFAVMALGIGPLDLFIYTTLPRGGYAAPVVLSTIILWLTGVLARRELLKHPPNDWLYAMLGFLCGMLWWSTQTLLATLLTCALWMVGTMRMGIFSRRFLKMGAFFFVGSLPWWLWHLFHAGTAVFYRPMLPRDHTWLIELGRLAGIFADVTRGPHAWKRAAGLLPLAWGIFAVGGGLLWVYEWRKRRRHFEWVHVGIALTFLCLFPLLFAASLFGEQIVTPHVLPLLPPMALMAACCTARLYRTKHAYLPIILLLLLLSAQVLDLTGALRKQDGEQAWEHAVRLTDYCITRNIEAVYVYSDDRWMNFAGGERVIYCDFEREPYVPYFQRANRADRIGLFGKTDEALAFLETTRTTAQRVSVAGRCLLYACGPPPQPARPLNHGKIASIRDDTDRELNEVLLDHDVDTFWSTRLHPGHRPQSLTLSFTQPVEASGIRLHCVRNRYPVFFSVTGRCAHSHEWIELQDIMPTTSFYWSGPRLYWKGLYYHMLSRFLAPAPLDRIRLTFHPHEDYLYTIELAELQVLGPPDPIPVDAWMDYIPELIQILKERNIMRCFADRWLSAKIDEYGAGRIRTVQPAFLERTLYSVDAPVRNEYHAISRFKPKDALLVPHAEAPALARMLRLHGQDMRRTRVGPWTLFDYAPGSYTRQTAIYPALKWVGYGALANREQTRKAKGHYHYQEALEADTLEGQLPLLRQAVELYPRHRAAWERLHEVARQAGHRAQELRALKELTALSPRLETPVSFRDGPRLLGMTPIRSSASPGEHLEIHYFWEFPPDLPPLDYAIFVHLQQGGYRFQDDHVLLDVIPEHLIRGQLTPETFLISRRFRIPEDAPPGDYSLLLGFYSLQTHARQQPVTRLQTQRRAVLMPLDIRVTEPSGSPMRNQD